MRCSARLAECSEVLAARSLDGLRSYSCPSPSLWHWSRDYGRARRLSTERQGTSQVSCVISLKEREAIGTGTSSKACRSPIRSWTCSASEQPLSHLRIPISQKCAACLPTRRPSPGGVKAIGLTWVGSGGRWSSCWETRRYVRFRAGGQSLQLALSGRCARCGLPSILKLGLLRPVLNLASLKLQMGQS